MGAAWRALVLHFVLWNFAHGQYYDLGSAPGYAALDACAIGVYYAPSFMFIQCGNYGDLTYFNCMCSSSSAYLTSMSAAWVVNYSPTCSSTDFSSATSVFSNMCSQVFHAISVVGTQTTPASSPAITTSFDFGLTTTNGASTVLPTAAPSSQLISIATSTSQSIGITTLTSPPNGFAAPTSQLTSIATPTPTPTASGTADQSSGGLSKGAIIAIAVVIPVVVILAGLVCCLNRLRISLMFGFGEPRKELYPLRPVDGGKPGTNRIGFEPTSSLTSPGISPVRSDRPFPSRETTLQAVSPLDLASQTPKPSFAVFVALNSEGSAVEGVLDEIYSKNETTINEHGDLVLTYVHARVGKHKLVVVYMPGPGNTNAAISVQQAKERYRTIKLCFVVGIAGGLANYSDREDMTLHLGDVVISTAIANHDEVRRYADQDIPRSALDNPPLKLNDNLSSRVNRLQTVGELRKLHTMAFGASGYLATLLSSNDFAAYRQPKTPDLIYPSNYPHKHWKTSCEVCRVSQSPAHRPCEDSRELSCTELGCDPAQARKWTTQDMTPRIHFGAVSSGYTVLRNSEMRDKLKQMKFLIVEMEGHSVWRYGPTLVIKAVCDYADGHKNKDYQRYAAATAASVWKALMILMD